MLPYSLEILSGYLANVHVPTEQFDPKSEWEQDYFMWSAVRPNRGNSDGKGSLQIRRRLTSEAQIRLRVSQVINMSGGKGTTTAIVTCANDELATPIRWKIESSITGAKGGQMAGTQVSVSGEAAGGSVVLHGEKDISTRFTGGLTSNWSLLEAVQRLPFDSKPIQFTMLEELELVRREQTLAPGKPAEVVLGGRMVKLHSFEQIGEGILPWTYWLDDNHRLVIAVGGRRAFVIESAGGGTK